MVSYIIFYYLTGDYENTRIDAKSLLDAVAAADAFSRKTGAVIVGICPEYLLNNWHHE